MPPRKPVAWPTPRSIYNMRDGLLGVTREERAERDLAWEKEQQERHPGPGHGRETPPRKPDTRKRLTPLELASIKGLIADGTLTFGAIARLAGVSRSTISRIAQGKREKGQP